MLTMFFLHIGDMGVEGHQGGWVVGHPVPMVSSWEMHLPVAPVHPTQSTQGGASLAVQTVFN